MRSKDFSGLTGMVLFRGWQWAQVEFLRRKLRREMRRLMRLEMAMSRAEPAHYSLVQWNWFSDVTGCTRVTCVQWRPRTNINFTALGCTLDHLLYSWRIHEAVDSQTLSLACPYFSPPFVHEKPEHLNPSIEWWKVICLSEYCISRRSSDS